LNWTTALPSINLFSALEALIRLYPSEERLRTALLDHLYSVLKDTLQGDPRAVKMLATRKLRELTSQENSGNSVTDEGEEFVNALQVANESFSVAVSAGSANASAMAEVYVEFIEEWCKLPTLDPNLVSKIHATLVYFSLAGKLARISCSFPPETCPTAERATLVTGCIHPTDIALQ
jgi:hypothetical protein